MEIMFLTILLICVLTFITFMRYRQQKIKSEINSLKEKIDFLESLKKIFDETNEIIKKENKPDG